MKSNAERQAAFRKRRAAELEALRNTEPLRNDKPEPEPLRNAKPTEPKSESLRNGISVDMFKSKMFKKLPKAIRDGMVLRNKSGIPKCFHSMILINAVFKLGKEFDKLESKGQTAAMKFAAQMMEVTEEIVKAIVDDRVPKDIKIREADVKQKEKDLREREDAILKGKVVIPDRMLRNGFTPDELKKLRSCFHPDARRNLTDKQLSDRFAMFKRVFPNA